MLFLPKIPAVGSSSWPYKPSVSFEERRFVLTHSSRTLLKVPWYTIVAERPSRIVWLRWLVSIMNIMGRNRKYENLLGYDMDEIRYVRRTRERDYTLVHDSVVILDFCVLLGLIMDLFWILNG